MLKRLSGAEFCSDAHFREYQQEYSQLAVTRLQQAKPRDQEAAPPDLKSAEAMADPARPLAAPAPPQTQNGRSTGPVHASIAAPVTVSPRVQSVRIQIPSRPINPVEKVRGVQPAPPQRASLKPPPPSPPSPPAPAKDPPKPAGEAPARMAGVLTRKPAAVSAQATPVMGSEVEWIATTPAPGRPNRAAVLGSAELARGDKVAWDAARHMQKPAMLEPESHLELRSSLHPVPVMDLGLGLSRARIWSPAEESVEIRRMAEVAPAAAALWQAPPLDFTGAVIGLVEAVEAAATQPVSPAVEPAPKKERGIADPVLEPMTVILRAAAAGRAKPVQAFTLWLPGGLAAQIPRSEALPLRPVMVLARTGNDTAVSAAPVSSEIPPANGKARKAEVVILAKEKPAPATRPAPVPITRAAPSAPSDPGLPELRVEPSRGPIPPQVWRIAAAIAAVLILAITIFTFTRRSGSKPKPAVAVAAAASEWIADFAPDSQRQRRVSVLRSSAKGADYRVEFESAIETKATGWVYRAQDAKNFYVNKIELRHPGPDPAFVLAHYAVIDGIDQPRGEAPLPVRVRLGENYRIRFEATGNRFATWVQDQKVDEWTDDRLKSGGAGLYSEGIERADLHGVFRVTPLHVTFMQVAPLDQKKEKRK